MSIVIPRVQLPKLAEPEADNLTDERVEKILAAVAETVVRSQSGAVLPAAWHSSRSSNLVECGRF